MKARVEGKTETVGHQPLRREPGQLLALSVMFTVPVRVPDAWGVNVTLIVQVPLSPKVELQVLEEMVKSLLFVPLNVKPVKPSVALPELVTVTG